MAKFCSQLDDVKLELAQNSLEFILEIDRVRIRNTINTDGRYCHAFCVTDFYRLYEIFNFFTVRFSKYISSNKKEKTKILMEKEKRIC